MSAGHGHGGDHGGPENKRIALLISVLALVLAFSETLGKSAQTTAIDKNIEASNMWSFFQAKTIRMTVLRTAAEAAEIAAARSIHGPASVDLEHVAAAALGLARLRHAGRDATAGIFDDDGALGDRLGGEQAEPGGGAADAIAFARQGFSNHVVTPPAWRGASQTAPLHWRRRSSASALP